MKIFFDGGCRGEPAVMAIAVVAAGQTTILRDLGHGTSGDAGWLTLIHALTIAKSLGLPDFVLIGDSADVVDKANGAVSCAQRARPGKFPVPADVEPKIIGIVQGKSARQR